MHVNPLKLGLLAAGLLLALGSPTAAAQAAPVEAAARPEVAARAGALEITFDELDDLLIERHALSPEGQAAIEFLARTTLLEALGAEAGIAITEAQLDERWAQLDAGAIESGVTGGLSAHLESSGVSAPVFRDTLRIALIHETLARRALDIPAEREISGESQQVWLDEQLQAAGFEGRKRPFEGGIVATIGSHPIRTSSLAGALREQLPAKELREGLSQLLLLRALEQRLVDLDRGLVDTALQAELTERRTRAEADPTYRGVSFEDLLRARGRDLDSMRRDPALRIAALARAWSGERFAGERLRDAYDQDRERFDALFGEAVSARAIWLAGEPSGDPRTAEQALAELDALAARITGEQSFAALAVERSEDTGSGPAGGALGYVTCAAKGVSPELAELLLAEAAAGAIGVSGPHRVSNGAVLVWIGTRRPPPAFEQMAADIERQLRADLLDATLAADSIRTYLDPDFVPDAAPIPAGADE